MAKVRKYRHQRGFRACPKQPPQRYASNSSQFFQSIYIYLSIYPSRLRQLFMHDNKRVRIEEVVTEQQQQVALYNPTSTNTSTFTSTVPTQRLYGHKSSVYALEYSPDGQSLASGGFDKNVLLWNCSGEELGYGIGQYCNYNVLSGHKNAVLDLKWSNDSESLVTASADKMLMVWDCIEAIRVRKLQGHDGVVNAVDLCQKSIHNICSASDDCTVRLWDARQKKSSCTIDHEYQVTSVAYAKDGSHIFTGGIDNIVRAWDVRQINAGPIHEPSYVMKGHTDTITCLSVSPDGAYLLSNSMDGTLKTWDIRPFVDGNSRECKTFHGVKHSAEKGLLKCAWSADGNMVTGGNADQVGKCSICLSGYDKDASFAYF